MFTLGLAVIAFFCYVLLIFAKIFRMVDIGWIYILSPIWITVGVVSIFGIGTVSFLLLLASVLK